jgi:hypothetical protein
MKTANSHLEPAYFHAAVGSDNHAISDSDWRFRLVTCAKEGRWKLTVDRVERRLRFKCDGTR